MAWAELRAEHSFRPPLCWPPIGCREAPLSPYGEGRDRETDSNLEEIRGGFGSLAKTRFSWPDNCQWRG